KNEYPEGSDRIRGVTVRRFANAQTRDLAAFNRYSEWIYSHPHSRNDEMEWLKQQGPWCPALVEHLRRQQQQYDVLVFFTYLYAPTVLGLEVCPRGGCGAELSSAAAVCWCQRRTRSRRSGSTSSRMSSAVPRRSCTTPTAS